MALNKGVKKIQKIKIDKSVSEKIKMQEKRGLETSGHRGLKSIS